MEAPKTGETASPRKRQAKPVALDSDRAHTRSALPVNIASWSLTASPCGLQVKVDSRLSWRRLGIILSAIVSVGGAIVKVLIIPLIRYYFGV